MYTIIAMSVALLNGEIEQLYLHGLGGHDIELPFWLMRAFFYFDHITKNIIRVAVHSVFIKKIFFRDSVFC